MLKPTRILAQLAVLAGVASVLGQNAAAAETLKLEVRETAGIRRFGYPIALTLPELSSAAADTRFRLRDGDKVVPAQFRQDTGGGAKVWWLDFYISLMPNETRSFTLEYGTDVKADAEPRGLEIKRLPDGFEIRNGSELTWTLGDSLHRLLKSVDAAGMEHVRSNGLGLAMQSANEAHDHMDDVTVSFRIVRSGPLAVVIRYELTSKAGPLADVKSTIDLTFPVSKSWVQADWQIDDPRQAVRSALARVAQNLNQPTEKEPTLIDFGASSLVYISLAPGTVGKLRAPGESRQSKQTQPRSWEVLRGAADRLEPFVGQPSGAESGRAEGWAHVMDHSRCLAMALAAFGDGGEDSIEVTATGDVRIAREFGSQGTGPPGKKSLQFWLHFVGFPPHVTAATSPQSMLSPLVVRVSRR